MRLTGLAVCLAAVLHAATGEAVPQLTAVDDFMNALLEQRQITGAAIAISRHGRLILSRGYGITGSRSTDKRHRRARHTPDPFVQPDSLFRIGKISRVVAAAAMLRLIEDGRLLPDQEVRPILTGAADIAAATSMIERAAGVTYEQYVQSALLAPLGITRMRLGPASVDDWIASAPDVLRFLNAVDGRRPPRLIHADLPASAEPTAHTSQPRDLKADSWGFVFHQVATGVDAVFLFNAWPRDGSAFDAEISAGIDGALKSVINWPPIDRFVTGPELFARDVVNAAGRTPGGVAPGEIVVLFPSNAGPPEIAEWPTGSTGGTRVFFDDIAAPIVYTVAGQVSAIVPHEVSKKRSTDVIIEYEGVRSPPVTLPVVSSTPAFFTRNASGTGQAAMLNATGCCNSPRNPVMRGSMAYLFATGEGFSLTPEDRKFTDEKPSPVAVPVSPDLKVTIGGVPAEVLYAGDAGVLQINIRVPENAPIGPAVPLRLSVGDSESPEGVTIAVRSPVLRVLVFQHEAEMRRRLAECLRAAGYDVALALDELETAARVSEGPVDLVITDLAMHPQASRRMIDAIQRENPQVKMIVTSGDAETRTLRAADLLGAQAVITRTATPDTLLRRVRDVLKDHFVAF
jgi:uncharacterized protein (TIGR03437 family)